MKKRNYGNNLGKPISYRLSKEDEITLNKLASVLNVSPGVFTRIQMEEILKTLKPLVMEQ